MENINEFADYIEDKLYYKNCDSEYSEILPLSNRKFTEIPEWIVEHDETLILELSYNLLEGVHYNIDFMYNLISIDLSHNEISVLPETFGNLINLKNINLSYNMLEELPPSICKLTRLCTINLNHNNLFILPSNFGNLESLERIHLENNKLKKLPISIGKLSKLRILMLDDNNLQHLPASFVELENLAILNLNNNRLKTLPRLIGQITTLKEITANNNKIKVLPESIYDLINLKHLHLHKNKIISLSNEIGNLNNLIVLNVKDNKLQTLPASLTRLNNLVQLQIENNPLEHIPPQVARLLQTRKTRVQIYDDNQNVHNHTIQESLRTSIENIMNQKTLIKHETIINEIMNHSRIEKECKEAIAEYCNDNTVHTVLNITFTEILDYVWPMITTIILENSNCDILKRLNEEMLDSHCKCFTGRITRLVNVLNGFSDLVSIQIHDTDQIANIIKIKETELLLQAQIQIAGWNGNGDDDGCRYTVEKHRELVRQELQERGYPEKIITEWIANIE